MRVAGVVAAGTLLAALAACTSGTPGPVPSSSVPPIGGAASMLPTGTSPPPAVAADTPTPSPTPVGGLQPVHDPGHVTGILTGPCHMTGTYPNQLSDPRCTPGSYDPAVTQANIHKTICVSGYTATVRPPEAETSRFKFNEAYPAYGIAIPVKTELDHLVSLELGGSNASTNLWPERPPTPNPKDSVENTLARAVCSGRVKLVAAQNAIASNWVTAEQVLGLVTPAPTQHFSTVPASAPAAAHTYPAPPPVVTTPVAAPPVSCYPKTSGGNCYEPGEFCRKADNGSSGVAGDGKSIVCTNGHWE